MAKTKITLTEREKEVGKGIAAGLTLPQIAANLKLGYETVKTYRERLGKKLGLTNKVEIALWVKQNPYSVRKKVTNGSGKKSNRVGRTKKSVRKS